MLAIRASPSGSDSNLGIVSKATGCSVDIVRALIGKKKGGDRSYDEKVWISNVALYAHMSAGSLFEHTKTYSS